MEKIKPRIEFLKSKKLIGMSVEMSLTNDLTQKLWRSFVPKVKVISNRVSLYKLSLQVYDSAYFKKFTPNKPFIKWALVEVSDFDSIPESMDPFELEGGMYAVFDYKGSSAKSYELFQYIFQTWLPDSEYEIDNRPHFELLGKGYRNNDVNSEEEIWIPIKRKST